MTEARRGLCRDLHLKVSILYFTLMSAKESEACNKRSASCLLVECLVLLGIEPGAPRKIEI